MGFREFIEHSAPLWISCPIAGRDPTAIAVKERAANWFAETFVKYVLHYATERFPSSIWQRLVENDDLLRKGYRLIKAQWADRQGRWEVGDDIYWNPETKHIVPVGKPQAAAATSAPVPSAKPSAKQWTLAKVQNVEGLEPNSPVVLSRRADGNWDFLVPTGQSGVIPGGEVVQRVQSVKDDETGKPISSTDPQQLFAIAGVEQPDPPQAKGTDPRGPGKGRPSAEDVRLPAEHMTEFNQKIEDRFVGEADSFTINALAGTGKTTMLKHLSSFIKPGERWLYLVFNKKNQVEASNEFPRGVDVATTHSYLGKVLGKAGRDVGGGTDLPPAEEKGERIYKIANQLIPKDDPHPFPKRLRWNALTRIGKIAKLAKAYAVDPRSPNIQEELSNVVSKYAIDMDLSTERYPQDRDYTPEILQKTAELLQVSLPRQLPKEYGRSLSNVRDQDDTLWYAAINADGIRWNANPKYDVVLMDEIQDFNRCQLVMAQKLREAGARVIGVGDPNQAMYLFRGADAEAFNDFQQIVGGGKESESLPINFRSGGVILDFVRNNTHVSDIQTAPHMEGKGEVNTDMEYQEHLNGIQEEFHGNRGQLSQDTAMIARTNAPLVATALQLLKRNVNFQIIGRDLSKELKDHIMRVTWRKPADYHVGNFADELSDYLENLKDEWEGNVSKAAELNDMEKTTEALIGVLGHLAQTNYRESERGRPLQNAKDFIGYIEEKLGGLDPQSAKDARKLKMKDPRSYVSLSTAHKAKGLEYGKAIILNPDEFDPQREQIKTPEEAQQEKHAWYVALTRAKMSLNIISDEVGA